MTQGKSQTDGPYQNPDIVSVQQRVDGVRHHAHQQTAQDYNAGRRHDITGATGRCSVEGKAKLNTTAASAAEKCLGKEEE